MREPIPLNTAARVQRSSPSRTAIAASAGARHERNQGFVHSAGDWDACASSTDEAPHPDCRSPIQVFLWPIAGRASL